MHTYSIRAAATKTTGHYRRPGTMTTYCTGAPTDLHANTAQARRVCARCVKAEARDRAEATATATAALAPETAGTLPAMVCIQHGTDCDGQPKRRHNFRPATTEPAPAEQPKPTTCGARRPGWTTGPAIGINRIPCTLTTHTTGDHRNAFGQTWPNYDAEKTAAEAAIASTYYTLGCNNHGAMCDGSPTQRHDYRHCVLTAEERDQIAAGTVPPWCYSTTDDRPAAAEESRQTAELITEAEATDGTWRGEWIGARDTGALFALPAADQGALFA